MAMTMHVDIVSAEGEIYSGTAEMIFAPSEMGDLGILPRHTPLLAKLKPGEVVIKTSEGENSIYVSGGMLEVQPHVVTVLSDTAVRAKDIDEAAANEAKQKAEEALKNRDSEVDLAQAEAELAQAVAQLQLLDKLRKAGRH